MSIFSNITIEIENGNDFVLEILWEHFKKEAPINGKIYT